MALLGDDTQEVPKALYRFVNRHCHGKVLRRFKGRASKSCVVSKAVDVVTFNHGGQSAQCGMPSRILTCGADGHPSTRAIVIHERPPGNSRAAVTLNSRRYARAFNRKKTPSRPGPQVSPSGIRT